MYNNIRISQFWVGIILVIMWLAFLLPNKINAQQIPQNEQPKNLIVINKDSVLRALDDFMQTTRRECIFTQEFPKVINLLLGNNPSSFTCRDFNYRLLKYKDLKPINPDLGCESQAGFTTNECQIAKRNCKLAIFDLKKYYEKCRTDIVESSEGTP